MKIGVIHPIESYWLKWGNEETTGAEQEKMDEAFSNLTKWLLYGLLDFDFIAESLLEELPDDGKGGFGVGAMHYEAIVVPGCITLRKNTINRLKIFAEMGGRIFWLGRIPEYMDALPMKDNDLQKVGMLLPYTKQAVCSALEPYRTVRVCDRQGMASGNLLSQQRQDGEKRWLFLSHCEKPHDTDDMTAEYWTIQVPGKWEVEQYDAMEGTISFVQVSYSEQECCTKWEVVSYAQDSFLYCLYPGCYAEEQEAGENTGFRNTEARNAKEQEAESQNAENLIYRIDECVNVHQIVEIPETVSVTMEEPNVVVLDMAEYRLDDDCWREKEEILRLDNVFRSELGYPMRAEAYAQPWIYGERAYEHKVSLRYTILSEVERGQVELALENEPVTAIVWNGESVSHKISGYYVDRQIHKVILPGLKKGKNVLEVSIPYHAGVDLEAMYLLGDFGVRVSGRTAVITDFSGKMAFGDICHQGLPFYGGNLVYRIPVELQEDGDLMVHVPVFRNPLIEVVLDRQESMEEGYSKDLFLSPYQVSFPQMKKGSHILELRAYGNRRNTFGQLHNCNGNAFWWGPDAWRTKGENWSYEYQLIRTGILVKPQLEIRMGSIQSCS